MPDSGPLGVQPSSFDMSQWVAVCRLEDIVPNTGVCALVGGRQVAVFRLDDGSVYAIDNLDPFSKANVLARGIVGDLKGELVVASPVYKQHFSLVTGRCIEDETVSVPVYGASVQGKYVMVQKPTAHNAAHNGRN
jgi:nitrite reductase (NADH) small subunit